MEKSTEVTRLPAAAVDDRPNVAEGPSDEDDSDNEDDMDEDADNDGLPRTTLGAE